MPWGKIGSAGVVVPASNALSSFILSSLVFVASESRLTPVANPKGGAAGGAARAPSILWSPHWPASPLFTGVCGEAGADMVWLRLDSTQSFAAFTDVYAELTEVRAESRTWLSMLISLEFKDLLSG